MKLAVEKNLLIMPTDETQLYRLEFNFYKFLKNLNFAKKNKKFSKKNIIFSAGLFVSISFSVQIVLTIGLKT